jgi:hypothetical protein
MHQFPCRIVRLRVEAKVTNPNVDLPIIRP